MKKCAQLRLPFAKNEWMRIKNVFPKICQEMFLRIAQLQQPGTPGEDAAGTLFFTANYFSSPQPQ